MGFRLINVQLHPSRIHANSELALFDEEMKCHLSHKTTDALPVKFAVAS